MSDEMDDLRAENERLRAALTVIAEACEEHLADGGLEDVPAFLDATRSRARAALGDK